MQDVPDRSTTGGMQADLRRIPHPVLSELRSQDLVIAVFTPKRTFSVRHPSEPKGGVRQRWDLT